MLIVSSEGGVVDLIVLRGLGVFLFVDVDVGVDVDVDEGMRFIVE